MAGKWEKFSIGDLEESPEAHWMRTVMGRKGQQWFSLRLTRDMAERFVEAFAAGFRTPGDLDPALPGDPGSSAELAELVDTGARIARSGYLLLRRFCRERRWETIDVDLLADHQALELLDLLSQAGGLEITAISPPCTHPVPPDRSPAISPESEEGDRQPSDDGEVIVAIIDDGIGVANHRFRLSEFETRVEYFLDMNFTQCPKDQCSEGHEDGFAENCTTDVIGKTWLKHDIDALFRENPRQEQAVYRAMGMTVSSPDRRQPLKHRHTHGTHVLDLAAGYDFTSDAEREEARKRPIIAVQLPSGIVADRSDSQMPSALKSALQWIEHAANELSERAIAPGSRTDYLPIVLNFSFGVFAGPHDGQGQVEQRISSFIQRYGKNPGNPQCEVVLPAGNGLQARSIANLMVGPTTPGSSIAWRVQPDDKTSSFVQIWLPQTPAETKGVGQISVTVIPPRDGPDEVVSSQLGCGLDWVIEDKTYVRIYHQRLQWLGDVMRERITIAIRPTETDSGHGPECPAGLWKIQIGNNSLPEDTKVDLRIQRDDPVAYERPKGRQSYFDDPNYVMFEPDTGKVRNNEQLENPPVVRQGTLSAYATGHDTVIVGGYRRSDGEPARYSSSGPAQSGRPGPDMAAVSEESPAHAGIIASGTYSGSAAIMNGTSVAAPLVTRRLADAFSVGKTKKNVVEEIRCREVGDICGPHGPYKKTRQERHGVGRLESASPPSSRTRIDS